jgi:hypothetical protein
MPVKPTDAAVLKPLKNQIAETVKNCQKCKIARFQGTRPQFTRRSGLTTGN